MDVIAIMKERIEYIDKLKGLAIILVVMGHISEKSMNITTSPFNLFYDSFHMPLFMFLSGIFAYKSFKKWNLYEAIYFLKKKTLRILMPFVVIGGVYSVCFCGNLMDVYLGVNSSYWFLPALFYCMLCGLIVYWIINFTGKSNKIYLVLCMHLILWMLLVMVYQMNCLDNVPYSLHAIKMYPFFIMGTLFTKYSLFKDKIIYSNNLFTISILGYMLLLIYGDEIPLKFNYTGVFAIVILVQLIVDYDSFIPKKMSFVGKYSLEIYVLHWFFLPALDSLNSCLSFSIIGIPKNFIILFCVTLIIAIPIIFVCILLSNIIRKSKFLNAVCFGCSLLK